MRAFLIAFSSGRSLISNLQFGQQPWFTRQMVSKRRNLVALAQVKVFSPLWEPGKQLAPAGSLTEAAASCRKLPAACRQPALEKVPAPFQVLKFS